MGRRGREKEKSKGISISPCRVDEIEMAIPALAPPVQECARVLDRLRTILVEAYLVLSETDSWTKQEEIVRSVAYEFGKGLDHINFGPTVGIEMRPIGYAAAKKYRSVTTPGLVPMGTLASRMRPKMPSRRK